ncbi:cell wall-binding repeat-containing protein [Micromonospora sp. NPDC049274]|uniref:cell wall-binding repeat-containing protein n=1 Tax=Micromonospora sp. NPDC049274 TaxID=3154829 RepID=UPI00343A0C7D
MSSTSPRRALAIASALAIGATGLVVATPAAHASLPGSGQVLTISNGSSSVQVISGTTRSTLKNPDGEAMRDVSWSPDGSRLIYHAPDGKIKSLRYTGADTVREVNYFVPSDIERAGTSWLGDGSSVVWAEMWKTSTYSRWTIQISESTWGGWAETIYVGDSTKHYRNPDAGPGQTIVFQREDDNGSGQPTGQPAVLLYDGAKPELNRVTVVDEHGANPALSPDGRRVAFVRDGQIITSDLTGANEVVITSNPAAHDNPTWSPDGGTIAFSQGTTVATAPADGSRASTPTVVSTTGGVPAYQPQKNDRVARLSGASRFDTAVQVSRSHWATAADPNDRREKAGAVVLSRSDTFADALAGSGLAGAKRAPLLMTPPTGLEAGTQAEIQRVLTTGGTVYLLGSPGALSSAVENEVRALGFQVKRLAGTDRFGTAVAIAKEADVDPAFVFVASGMDFPDALTAGSVAGSEMFPGTTYGVVVLSNGSALPPATESYLDSLTTPSVWGVGRDGSAAALSFDPNAYGLFEADRYGTAAYVAQIFFAGQQYAGIATGADWPDGLAGGALMAALNGPLLLTPGTATDLGVAARDSLDETSGAVKEGLVFGAAAVVTNRQASQVGTWIGGPLGSASVTNPTDVGVTLRRAPTAADAAAARAAQDVERAAVAEVVRNARQAANR